MLGKLMMNGLHLEVVITYVPGKPWASMKTPIWPAVTGAIATGNLPNTSEPLDQLLRINNPIIVVVNTSEQRFGKFGNTTSMNLRMRM